MWGSTELYSPGAPSKLENLGFWYLVGCLSFKSIGIYTFELLTICSCQKYTTLTPPKQKKQQKNRKLSQLSYFCHLDKGAPVTAMLAFVLKVSFGRRRVYFRILPLIPWNIDFGTFVPDAASFGVVEHHEVRRSKTGRQSQLEPSYL